MSLILKTHLFQFRVWCTRQRIGSHLGRSIRYLDVNAPAAVGVLVPRQVLRHRGAARGPEVDRAEAARDDEAGHEEERPAIVARPVAVVDLRGRREEVHTIHTRMEKGQWIDGMREARGERRIVNYF